MKLKRKVLFITMLSLAYRKNLLHKKTTPLNTGFNKTLVLSSGGLMGVAWHLATLERLSKEGLVNLDEYDLRIGTSAGGIAALAIGSGRKTDELIEELVSSALNDETKLYNLNSNTKIKADGGKGVLRNLRGFKFPHIVLLLTHFLEESKNDLNKVEDKINNLLNYKWPSKETWITTAESTLGVREVINKESQVTPGFAAAATSAVPALFSPKIIRGKKLVDGGVISSIHLDLALRSTRKEILLLTTSQGFVNPLKSRNWLKIINLLNENFEELSLKRAIIEAKIKKINLTIVRPRLQERNIFNNSGLMDDSKVAELLRVTLTS